MQRRRLVTALSVAPVGLVIPTLSICAEPSREALPPGIYTDFNAWLKAARGAALQYLRDFGVGDTQRFMRYLAWWACAMPDPPDPAWQPVPGANRPLEMATVAPGRPFVVGAFRMAPGCVIPTHCHPGGGGVTICTRGSVTLQHFELQDGSASFTETGGIAVASQVKVARLRAGEATLFTPTDANLHQLRAGDEGAMGVDIAVQWQGGGEFSFLKLDEDVPASLFQPLHGLQGRWTGMEIASAYAT